MASAAKKDEKKDAPEDDKNENFAVPLDEEDISLLKSYVRSPADDVAFSR
jgi:hypothetical protein